ncbi:phosphodiester glycosidase family protein [Muricomes intestini]|jgi:exopolysaccharide biosynthesis protein|uniref:Exopolysaccharide biosynthesis protein n=1 Tax=Muricomes intestini TaxID=1796634 RepID=A0A4R3JY76_9FIRM|nr:phosphodiester glycosidase family protein [Muricomes intestini]TCS72586.1 exopolysaccharide biosynthesis protein [Muricomes intestini]HAX51996.1 exopolysaccharide biosynthesis protein [Lachnospiraceae bacterium]HCR82770.1 exopolysaccharide biosynthesis protein [Lachnospiraceae bacterium]
MKLIKKKYLWAVLFSIILTAYTVFVALDTFVITHVYTVVDSGSNAGSGNPTTLSASEDTDTDTSLQSAVVTEDSYSDENVTVKITTYRENDTNIYVADVTLSSAKYLKTALANNAYGQNLTETTSDIASANNAILAINGDYYGAQRTGYVLKNGVLYRDTAEEGQEDLAIGSDGSFKIIKESEITAAELLDEGAAQILSFGPGLVENGNVSVTAGEEVGKAKASNPRTAIGIIDDLHYALIVSDGRTDESTGLSLYQFAEFMQGLGVQTAYNLDGGGSSTMYFNGKVINNPTTNGNRISERKVSDIVYIG